MFVRSYLLSAFIPWFAKTVFYHYAFRWRHIHATLQTKLIVAGAPVLIRAFLPIPLPSFIFFLFTVGAGVYLCRQFTDGKLYPDILAIVVGIELFTLVVIEGLVL